MDNTLVKNLLLNWHDDIGYKIKYCSPETKFVTGDQNIDAKLHKFEIDSGVEITLAKDWRSVENYKVIDEEKFLMFALRYV